VRSYRYRSFYRCRPGVAGRVGGSRQDVSAEDILRGSAVPFVGQVLTLSDKCVWLSLAPLWFDRGGPEQTPLAIHGNGGRGTNMNKAILRGSAGLLALVVAGGSAY